ncbi:phosphoserine phosphatase SerB [Demequina lutea]|uniref:phosphoserine phosphatase n=1 Tax=Demequina lutea TaxID=431489 RepID=A0A7Y9ZA36_9MICO|nr:phosphoserine phosphatase SerB [Demequina lutea]NYI41602.1 phosphoserine phosphatase [Demequina lutea]
MSEGRLLVLDVDSTLIQQEVIELLAARAGSLVEVAAITDRAMRGELDFAESLKKRVATLKGLPLTVFADVAAEVALTPGAAELVATAQEAGWTVGLVSGGFEEVVSTIASRVNVTHFVANRLEVLDGVLTGRTVGPVIDRNAKAVALLAFARAAGVAIEDTVAIGDGANDLGMMDVAGLSVAFSAKPVVRDRADIAIDGPRLDVAWPLIAARSVA